MKKLISILLAIILIICTFCTNSFAADETTDSGTTIGENEENPDEPGNPDEPIEPEEPKTLDDYEYVATMYICATANSLTGHVWLYFVNLTECELPLGYITLNPGEGMSVGSLRNTRKDGGGTYYNGEAKMAKNLDKVCKHTHSLSMDLTLDELNTVSEKIKSKNSYEMIFYNCGVFATNVWNSVSDKKVVHVTFPLLTIMNMSILGAKKGQIRMQEPLEGRYFKQDDDGVHVADVKSFRASCVG